MSSKHLIFISCLFYNSLVIEAVYSESDDLNNIKIGLLL